MCLFVQAVVVVAVLSTADASYNGRQMLFVQIISYFVLCFTIYDYLCISEPAVRGLLCFHGAVYVVLALMRKN